MMRVMLFAAGLGQRLRPLTAHCPKCLLQVGGRPLIEHHLLRLAEAGAERVVINIAWLGEQVLEALGDGSRFGLDIRYSHEPDPDKPLDTGGGLRFALPLLGPGPMLSINADIWSNYPVAGLLRQKLSEQCLAHLVLVDNPAGKNGDFMLNERGRVGLLSAGDGRALTFSGIAILSPQLLEGFEQLRFSLAEPLRLYAARGRLSGEHYGGEWCDAGTPESLAALRSRFGDELPSSG